MGRTSSYDPAFCDQARKLCEKFAATDPQIADYLGCSERTLYRWKVDHPEFKEAMNRGKETADDAVEFSLFQRAVGFRAPAVKHFQVGGEIHTEEYEEYIPPETKAAIFWLCNRRRDRWSNAHMKGIGQPGDDSLPESIRVEIVDGRAKAD